MDQARAIWNALDSMLEQDPEGYKRFVTEQLQEGRRMLEKEGSSLKNQTNPHSKQSMCELERAFGMVSLSCDEESAHLSPKSSEQQCDRNDGKDNFNWEIKNTQKRTTEEDSCVGTSSCAKTLLDDEIGKTSILAQIVKKPESSQHGGNESGGGDKCEVLKQGSLKAIGMNGQEPLIKKKPLIEEI